MSWGAFGKKKSTDTAGSGKVNTRKSTETDAEFPSEGSLSGDAFACTASTSSDMFRRSTTPDEGQPKGKRTSVMNQRRKSILNLFTNYPEEEEEVTKSSQDTGYKGVLVDPQAMKEKVREKLTKPQYRVTDFYHKTGCCQVVARSVFFDKLTLAVIAFNAIWIAVDTDMNDADMLSDADITFVIAENFFCAFFFFEWCMRFGSFRKKGDGCKDAWFVFDTFMVSMMVLETWIFTGMVLISGDGGGGGGANVGLLRLARLLRLSRMARMGKLLRVMPELLIMLKGMKAAMRSVFWTLVLLVMIMYIFAILFVQLGDGTKPGEKYFPAVPKAMYTLLIYGIFLDDVKHLTDRLGGEWILACAFFAFVLLGALTVMNMLIGVLCEVVSAVAATEREEMLVQYVNDRISRVMALVDTDGSGTISKKEFELILTTHEAIRCLNEVGVDVFALIDLADYIFMDESGQDVELDFCDFMEIVLQLRGTNTATVKDIVDLRKYMRLLMQENSRQTSQILDKLSGGAKLTEAMMTSQRHLSKHLSRESLGREEKSMSFGKGKRVSQRSEAPSTFATSEASNVKSTVLQDAAFDVSSFTDTEAGKSLKHPLPTPSGEFLTWVPIVDPEIVSLSAAWEELGLRGSPPVLQSDSSVGGAGPNWATLAPRPGNLQQKILMPLEKNGSVPGPQQHPAISASGVLCTSREPDKHTEVSHISLGHLSSLQPSDIDHIASVLGNSSSRGSFSPQQSPWQSGANAAEATPVYESETSNPPMCAMSSMHVGGGSDGLDAGALPFGPSLTKPLANMNGSVREYL